MSSETLLWLLSHFTDITTFMLSGLKGYGTEYTINSQDIKNMVSD